MRRWFRHPEPQDIVPYCPHEYMRRWADADRRIYTAQIVVVVAVTALIGALATLGFYKLVELLFL
jgi:hypothetical protein